MLNISYRAKGLYFDAIELLENYAKAHPSDSYIPKYLASVYICLGQLDKALAEVEKAISLKLNRRLYIITRGDIHLYKGELTQAEEEYQKQREKRLPRSVMFGIGRLASLYLLQGKFENSYQIAQEGLEQAMKINDKEWMRHWMYVLAYLDLKLGHPKNAVQKLQNICDIADEIADLRYHREALHLKAIAYLEGGLINEAQKTTDELTEMLQSLINKKKLRLSYHLLGMLELKKEKPSKAIFHFKKALALMPFQYQPRYGDNHAMFMGPLAFSYYKAGDLERAQEMYEKIVALTSGRLHYGDVYAKAFYMLGRIYEQKGWEGKAIENYEKFLDLWKDADPGIAEVEDAKLRLARLKSNK
jgi:tetratricopeptide (TPR) repeat protein